MGFKVRAQASHAFQKVLYRFHSGFDKGTVLKGLENRRAISVPRGLQDLRALRYRVA